MLCLSRREGEKIVAGDLTIHVVKIERGKVRLAFEAPDHLRIDREEVHRKRKRTSNVQHRTPNAEVRSSREAAA